LVNEGMDDPQDGGWTIYTDKGELKDVNDNQENVRINSNGNSSRSSSALGVTESSAGGQVKKSKGKKRQRGRKISR